MKRKLQLTLFLLFFWTSIAIADDIIIDKIYHPYVQPLEKSLEWRAIYQNHQETTADDVQLHQLSYGFSLNDRWSGELYVVGKNSAEQNFDIEAYEADVQWQATEQGEYWADLGVLFEFEKEVNVNIWEFNSALLAEKEWGHWSTTANFFVVSEWGSDITDEIETKFNLQARYRYSRQLEPAFEFYNGENTMAVGPVLLGQFNLKNNNRLHWEAGILFGLDSASPDQTLRFLAEYEF